jgi:hypothetical protein
VSDFDWRAHPDRLNLGCGFDLRPGYLNVDLKDFHSPDLVADIRELTMLPPGHYREILAIDCLEHLPRTDTDRALAEWRRLLAPGGRLYLQVPDLAGIARRLAAASTADDQRGVIQQLFGTQAYTGDFHLTSFTDLTLCDHLGAIGLEAVTLWGRDGWLLEAEGRAPDGGPPARAATAWGPGCYPLEVAGGSSWRWCESSAKLLLHNPLEVPLPVTVRARVEAPGSRSAWLRVEGPGRGLRLRVGRRPSALEIDLELPPGPTRLHLHTDAARVVADDPRVLHFRLVDPEVVDRGPVLAGASAGATAAVSAAR